MKRIRDISRLIVPNRGWRSGLVLIAFIFVAVVSPLLILTALDLGEDKSVPPKLSLCNNATTSDGVVGNDQPTDAQILELKDTIQDFKAWLSTNYDSTITCARIGEIDWADFSSKLDHVGKEHNLAENYAKNGTFELFNSADIERMIGNARCLMNETNMQCGGFSE